MQKAGGGHDECRKILPLTRGAGRLLSTARELAARVANVHHGQLLSSCVLDMASRGLPSRAGCQGRRAGGDLKKLINVLGINSFFKIPARLFS